MQEKYQRLGRILERLCAGEKLKIGALAKEYKVSTKTIQRDLKERLGFCKLTKEGHTFYLASTMKNYGKDYFIVGMLKEMIGEIGGSFAAQAMPFFELIGVCDGGSSLTKEVAENLVLCFKARQKGVGLDFYYQQEAYRGVRVQNIVIANARLVLEAVLDQQVRHLDIAKLTKIKLSQRICGEALGECRAKELLSLFVYPQTSEAFKQSILAQEARWLEDKDGSLVVEKEVENLDDWVAEVMYWIPNVVVLEPQRLKDQIVEALKLYSERNQ
ncbi:hypothetical protein BBW65_04945 [Helicobacter enhydrae]|uniref:WYL domain-containing protein n=1 Tax=Helicobacter enhydrae TaxID=222136 RepID=A0A1B1U5X6_9HELI|nr:WYL domain-containing protein [Helicobacter enhydrae]ANV98183.1 hypothetical protein BBW65_04945 [Helicobacter enhydrae]